MSPKPARRRSSAPPGRCWFTTLPALLGLSPSTVKRRYRPADVETRREWTLRLDIRTSARGLHCDLAQVEALRCQLDAEALGGHLAFDNCPQAIRLIGAKRHS
jgi:hypothetical protein